MNPFIYPAKCAVCGGLGMYDARHGGGADWLYEFTHSDPMVCKANLEAKRRKQAEVEEMETVWGKIT